jgi:hypothetical protein
MYRRVLLFPEGGKISGNLGPKVFNLTNHCNPRDFQNNLASDSFGVFSNGVGRVYGTHQLLKEVEIDRVRRDQYDI